MLDRLERGEPAVDAGPAVKVVQERVLRGEDRAGRGLDDCPDQVVSVFEVVVELAATGVRAGAHLVEAHLRDPALRDQLSGGLDDPRARRASLLGRRLGDGHDAQSNQSGLDSPLRGCFAFQQVDQVVQSV